MQKLLLLVCLQTSMVMEGQVKQYDFSQKKDLSRETVKPKDKLCGFMHDGAISDVKTSKKAKVSKTQWRPGKTILGKKRSKVNLRDINEFNYRSDRLSEVKVPVQKVTETQKDPE